MFLLRRSPIKYILIRVSSLSFLLFIAFSLFSPSVQAADLVISGNPLKITADEYGSMDLERKDNGSYVKQYYEDSVSFLFLNDSDLAFDSHDPLTLGGDYANTRFTPVSHAQPDDWTLETVYSAGTTGVQITRTITYTNGDDYYLATYAINNGGSSTYSNIKFRYGGDTYFAGDDGGVGNYDSTLKMVYLTNPSGSITHLMGIYGSLSHQVDNYYEDGYVNVWTALADADDALPDTVNASDIDNGYGAEWTRSSLAPGETWTVEVFEKWMTGGHVRVVGPSSQSNEPGRTNQYQFSVENYQTSEDTFDLSLSSASGWTTLLPDGSSVTVGAASSGTVTAEVTVPSGTAKDTSDVLTLTATSQADGTITRSGSTSTIVLPETGLTTAGPPVCQDTPPAVVPDLFQIDTTFASATLYFTPINNNLSYYFIAYGLSEGDESFSVEYPDSPSSGVESYTIEALSPNTTYHFRVRGGNGCAAGEWSNWLAAKIKPIVTPESFEPEVDEEGEEEVKGVQEEKQVEEKYTVKVKVVDASKNSVEGAKVTLTSEPREATTDEKGEATFDDVEKGEHKIAVAYKGQEGEQKIDVEGDIEVINFTIQLKRTSPLTAPSTVFIIGVLLFIIGGLSLRIKKTKK